MRDAMIPVVVGDRVVAYDATETQQRRAHVVDILGDTIGVTFEENGPTIYFARTDVFPLYGAREVPGGVAMLPFGLMGRKEVVNVLTSLGITIPE
jgi:hypothetical protein